MTVIATDGKTIAADSLMCYGDEKDHAAVTKIMSKNGIVVASAGLSGMLKCCTDWYLAGASADSFPKVGDENIQLLVLDGTSVRYFTNTLPHGVGVGVPFTMGSGGSVAHGSMLAGASPERAVEIACKVITSCGLPVMVVDIDDEVGKWNSRPMGVSS